MPISDEQLVAAVLDGDKAAFGELAQRYRAAVLGIAFHKLGDFETARDVAQEALLSAYVDLPTLRDPSKFGHWLYRIASSSALAHLRKQHCTARLEDYLWLESDRPETNPSESVFRAEKSARVREALDVLPEQDRLSVILHYVDGYSHEEIGGILGASVSSVKSRVHRARRRLKREMLDMVEDTLKSEVPNVEFSEDLVRSSLRKYPDHKFALLENMVVARLQYTADTVEAICRLAQELAHEGYRFLVAPPHIREGDPAVAFLQGLGFQVETEMLWYERSLTGRLPVVPVLGPGLEVRPLIEARALDVLDLLGRTTQRHHPKALDESWVKAVLLDKALIKEASLAAYDGEALVGLVLVFRADDNTAKYGASTAVLFHAVADEGYNPAEVLQFLIASGLGHLKKAGIKKVVKDQIMPEHAPKIVPMLDKLGFQRAPSQYNLRLDLAALSGPLAQRVHEEGD